MELVNLTYSEYVAYQLPYKLLALHSRLNQELCSLKEDLRERRKLQVKALRRIVLAIIVRCKEILKKTILIKELLLSYKEEEIGNDELKEW